MVRFWAYALSTLALCAKLSFAAEEPENAAVCAHICLLCMLLRY